MFEKIPAFIIAISLLAALGTATSSLAQDEGTVAEEQTPSAGSEAIELKDPVATVNGRNISSAELKQAISQQLARAGRTIDQVPQQMLLEGYHQVLDNIIIDELLSEKAASVELDDKQVEENLSSFKAQFPSEKEMNDMLQQNGETLEQIKKTIADNMKKREWITSRVKDDEAVSDEEVKKFYDENKESFKQPEMVRASHILISTPQDLNEEQLAAKKQAIDDLKKQLDEGADFAELAKQHSEDPGSKDNGGDLDFFTKDRMVPEFANAAFAAEVGKVTDPVKSKFGYHLIKVTERKEAGTVSVDEAKPQIEGFLKNQKQQQQVEQLLTALKQQADIKVNLPPLAGGPTE